MKYKTHLTTASSSVQQNKTALIEILKAIKESGGVILENWVKREFAGINKKSLPSQIFSQSRKAIKKSDIIIAECSYPSNSLGANIEYALSLQIPVLCLHLEGKEKNIGKVIAGSGSSLFKISKYSPSDAKNVIEEFVSILLRKRIKYSIFLNSQQSKYIEYLVKKKRSQDGPKSSYKSEVVREIINKAIEQDRDYQ